MTANRQQGQRAGRWRRKSNMAASASNKTVGKHSNGEAWQAVVKRPRAVAGEEQLATPGCNQHDKATERTAMVTANS